MKIFEFSILHHKKPTKKEEEEGVQEESTILVDVTRILAKDIGQAWIIAARKIPESYMGKLSQVEIAIRPF